jgi:hypothetical protein
MARMGLTWVDIHMSLDRSSFGLQPGHLGFLDTKCSYLERCYTTLDDDYYYCFDLSE